MTTKRKWKKVGLLNRNVIFNSRKEPIESLHKAIKEMVPGAESVSDVAVSPATNRYLRERLTAYAKKKYKMGQVAAEKQVTFEMFQYSPADYSDGIDFVLYASPEAIKRKTRKE